MSSFSGFRWGFGNATVLSYLRGVYVCVPVYACVSMWVTEGFIEERLYAYTKEKKYRNITFFPKCPCNLKTSTIKRFLYIIIFIFSSPPTPSHGLKIDPSSSSSLCSSREGWRASLDEVEEKEKTGVFGMVEFFCKCKDFHCFAFNL